MPNTEVSLGNTYELNKNFVKQLKPMNDMEIASMYEKVADWMKEPQRYTNLYYTLMCRERYDFTVFNLTTSEDNNTEKKAVKEIFDIAFERGKIIEISKDETGSAYEFWLLIGDEVFLYLLFPFDSAVIEVR
jgi:hypothetical protein